MWSHHKYQPYPKVDLPDRQWPNNSIDRAPIWCAVDLRDGNQSLINPMDLARKLKMYELLVKIGFKQIEVGFPSSSQIEFDFLRQLITENRIPADVTPQVLVQARDHLIDRTFESLEGADRAIVHLYNSTSIAQRRDVFGMEVDEIKQLARHGTEAVKRHCEARPGTQWTFQYSPESFTGTELSVALDICNTVIETWDPSPDAKMIINLPATVETSTPNIFADQIEWMGRNLARRDQVILSVHTHNDRGTGIASTELAVMAGAERVEGTLFGNGERTGNADLVVLAMNLYTQGVDPQLDLHDLPRIVSVVEECNQIETHIRHPYTGELVFTAFSGSHQDAIKKGLAAHTDKRRNKWDVPYLPIEPGDVGRTYEETIRVNSQSGKGGIAFVLETEYGVHMPKGHQVDFAKAVQRHADALAQEVLAGEIWRIFKETYLAQKGGLEVLDLSLGPSSAGGNATARARFVHGDRRTDTQEAVGNGPINAFVALLKRVANADFTLIDYQERSMTSGSDSKAIAYVVLKSSRSGETAYGVGIHSDITLATVNAVVSAFNRSGLRLADPALL